MLFLANFRNETELKIASIVFSVLSGGETNGTVDIITDSNISFMAHGAFGRVALNELLII